MDSSASQLQLLVNMTLTAWDSQNSQFNKLLSSLSDAQLVKEIAPGKNSGIYLLGHLIAVSDGLLPLLGFGEKLFPEWEEVFIKNPDKSGMKKPSTESLRESLEKVNTALNRHFKALTVNEWFEKHTAVSNEDFLKEPHRNRLNVVISRTNHMANHIGQLLLLKD